MRRREPDPVQAVRRNITGVHASRLPGSRPPAPALLSQDLEQLLFADIALMEGAVPARDVAAAIQRYWDRRQDVPTTVQEELTRIAGLHQGALAGIARRSARLVQAVGGDVLQALESRGGVAQDLHHAMGDSVAGASTCLSRAGISARAPLRTVAEGRYTQFEIVGEGGMGIVYRAQDHEMNRWVAFKMVRPDAGTQEGATAPDAPLAATRPARDTPASEAFDNLRARFLQEAWITGGLEHPGIVPVHELGQTRHGIPFYTMRYIRGETTLATAIRDARGLPFEDRLRLLEPLLRLCDAVAYAHDRGVIHRDLKPANVALGGFGEVMLLDWGLAKLEGLPDAALSCWQQEIHQFRDATSLRTEMHALGTPGYMAPEAARGEVSRLTTSSDVHGLAAMAYEVLAGRLPYRFRGLQGYRDQVEAGPPPPAHELDPRIPVGLSDVLAAGLDREPDTRIPTAGAFAAALREWQARHSADLAWRAEVEQVERGLATAARTSGAERTRALDEAAAALQRVPSHRSQETEAQALAVRLAEERDLALQDRLRAQTEGATRRGQWVVTALVVLAILAGAVAAAGALMGG